MVSLVNICIDSFAPSKGNDLFSFEKNDEFNRMVGHCSWTHPVHFFFSLLWLRISSLLSAVQDFRIPVQHSFCFSGSTACFIAKCSKRWLVYLLRYSESGIAYFLYGTHNDRTENGKTYQVDVYFLPLEDNTLLILASALSSFFDFPKSFCAFGKTFRSC